MKIMINTKGGEMRYYLLEKLKKTGKIRSPLPNADNMTDNDLIMNALAVLLEDDLALAIKAKIGE